MDFKVKKELFAQTILLSFKKILQVILSKFSCQRNTKILIEVLKSLGRLKEFQLINSNPALVKKKIYTKVL